MSDKKYWESVNPVFTEKKLHIEYPKVGLIKIEKVKKNFIGKQTEENKKVLDEYKKLISYFDSKKNYDSDEFENKVNTFIQKVKDIYNSKIIQPSVSP